jgi:integrase
MPKKAKELSAIAVSRLVTPGMHAAGGVAGLHLQVKNPTSRSWVLRALVGGKRCDIGLGGFPDVTLADARAKAREAREKIVQGIDPIAERKAARLALASAPITFAEASRRYIAVKSPEWKNEKHRSQWGNTLETYAHPFIGKLPVDKVEIAHVVEILEPLWTTKTQTAKRLRGRVESVLDWATAMKYRTGDNPARWRGSLESLLPMPGKVHKVKHHKAVDRDAMPELMRALEVREGTSAMALRFLILTAARSGEVRGAKWSEIDLDGAVWTVPAERMKAGNEHRVPLSKPAVALLRALPRHAGTGLVFAAPRGGELSDMSLTQVMRRMGMEAVPHGFRSTFRDWVSEVSNYPHDVAEMALAHKIPDKVVAAYKRGDLMAKRTAMMADWAKFIFTPMRRKKGGE